MAIELTKGAAYDSVAYGVVQYKNSSNHKNDDGTDYIVHKFQTTRGTIKYILADELAAFLRKPE